MKETGIIMSGDHPVKVLQGKKTQTRRTYGLEAINAHPDDWVFSRHYLGNREWVFQLRSTGEPLTVKCPYGGIGDFLWMKEKWQVVSGYSRENLDLSRYYSLIVAYSDGTDTEIACEEELFHKYIGKEKYHKWQPSIFIPRIFSRADLEIVDLYPVRTMNILPEDIIAEGISEPEGLSVPARNTILPALWLELWDKINGSKFPALNNYWAWKISFALL